MNYPPSLKRKCNKRADVADQVLNAVRKTATYQKCFLIDAAGGTGKTFVFESLYGRLTAEGKKVQCVAYTGIAANLLPDGRTVHNFFKLPVPLEEGASSRIEAQSSTADVIRQLSLIIWDEAPMSPRYALEAVNILLKDIMRNNRPFGGKTMLLGGDFRQILPVVPHSSKGQLIDTTLKSSALWREFKVLHLHLNMRTGPGEADFAAWLLRVGDGQLEENSEGEITIPDEIVSTGDLVAETFGEYLASSNLEGYKNRAILTPKNRDTFQLNSQILKVLPGKAYLFKSRDELPNKDDPSAVTEQPTEFLNSLTPSGFPPHLLTIKEGAIVMLQRNLSTATGMSNGTRIVVKTVKNNVIHGQILIGRFAGRDVLIPNILLRDTTPYGIDFVRNQFPIRNSFSMTINKSQGQTLEKEGLHLPDPCFSHGQLYVALSRVRNKDSIKVQIIDKNGQPKKTTKNVVYNEIL